MSKADSKCIRAELKRLDEREVRIHRQWAVGAKARRRQQEELDTLAANRKQWQELLAKQETTP